MTDMRFPDSEWPSDSDFLWFSIGPDSCCLILPLFANVTAAFESRHHGRGLLCWNQVSHVHYSWSWVSNQSACFGVSSFHCVWSMAGVGTMASTSLTHRRRSRPSKRPNWSKLNNSEWVNSFLMCKVRNSKEEGRKKTSTEELCMLMFLFHFFSFVIPLRTRSKTSLYSGNETAWTTFSILFEAV